MSDEQPNAKWKKLSIQVVSMVGGLKPYQIATRGINDLPVYSYSIDQPAEVRIEVLIHDDQDCPDLPFLIEKAAQEMIMELKKR